MCARDDSLRCEMRAQADAASHSAIPQTASLHPPQPVVALVAVASSLTSRAPARQALTSAALLTVLHRQTTAEPGSSVGLCAGLAALGRALPSSTASRSVGTGTPRS